LTLQELAHKAHAPYPREKHPKAITNDENRPPSQVHVPGSAPAVKKTRKASSKEKTKATAGKLLQELSVRLDHYDAIKSKQGKSRSASQGSNDRAAIAAKEDSEAAAAMAEINRLVLSRDHIIRAEATKVRAVIYRASAPRNDGG